MDLSLTEAEQAALQALGVAAAPDGTLRGRGGRVVEPGAAVALLAKSALLTDSRRGHSDGAAGPAGPPLGPLPGGGPAVSPRVARTGPAGPAGPAGSGTADRDLEAGEGWDGTGDQVDPDWGDGDEGLLKMTPLAFQRHYLAAGHAAESPANTGHQQVIPAPSMDVQPGGRAHVAEPQDFGRGPLTAGHQAVAPANDPAGNNAHPPGTAAHEVYAAAERRYADNLAQSRMEHVMVSQGMTPSAQSAPNRVAMPDGMRASAVPQETQVAATRPAPGEA